jgi:hypothetical protein
MSAYGRLEVSVADLPSRPPGDGVNEPVEVRIMITEDRELDPTSSASGISRRSTLIPVATRLIRYRITC